MEPIASDGLWYVDSLDQFSSTMAGADGSPRAAPTTSGDRAKKTSVFMDTVGASCPMNAVKQPATVNV